MSTEWAAYGWPDPAAQPPRRPWYKAPGSLIGATWFTASFAWVTAACIAAGLGLLSALENADSFEEFVFGMFGLMGLAVLFTVGMAAFVLAVAGAAATVPLAVIWLRDPQRSRGPGASLLHALVAWAVLAVALVRLP